MKKITVPEVTILKEDLIRRIDVVIAETPQVLAELKDFFVALRQHFVEHPLVKEKATLAPSDFYMAVIQTSCQKQNKEIANKVFLLLDRITSYLFARDRSDFYRGVVVFWDQDYKYRTQPNS